MQIQRVAQILSEHCRGSAFGTDRMGPVELHFGYQAHIHMASQLPRDLDRSSKSGKTGAEN
jgi:hypothetical protein